MGLVIEKKLFSQVESKKGENLEWTGKMNENVRN